MKTIKDRKAAAQARVLRAKSKYDEAVRALDEIEQQEKLLESKELQKALAKSTRSYEEILAFLQGEENPQKEDENPY